MNAMYLASNLQTTDDIENYTINIITVLYSADNFSKGQSGKCNQQDILCQKAVINLKCNLEKPV